MAVENLALVQRERLSVECRQLKALEAIVKILSPTLRSQQIVFGATIENKKE
jgi:hypothetical protein